MTVLLLEDEYPAAERLQRLLLQAAPDARVLAVLDSVADAVAWLTQNPAPDLILSDIQLADGLSLDVFDQVLVRSPVIFATAYDAYALRAFKANSIDYLLKPIKLAELQAALAKLREWQPHAPARQLETLRDSLPRPAHAYKTRFLVRSGEQLLPLPAAAVAWFQSRHETTTLVAADGRRYVVDYTLEQLEKLLDPQHFFRLNRQLLTHLQAVQRLHPHFNGKLKLDLQPAPSEEVLVSREKAGAFKSWLEG
ncbi:two component transcriptional regulator, LytTR family [Hymenobacter daecheongensis DSM 21074]|uniref:Two component transcriptional regulator, LytTR family n=1 Tax=Hymenobacter daecheongensis DSM 21074 TaxID=1121955 RepID=A0A1M6KRY5_9BACT|nr:LytTR family DNA-binding domain-containing protein [Hymenobacter daecheongensis]SHJ61735.1 two component transcriptional regulator, LytTR family [Hymenobacter daecheongensis DSM 21074]